jgi:uncharacterized protein (DUF1684 family)
MGKYLEDARVGSRVGSDLSGGNKTGPPNLHAFRGSRTFSSFLKDKTSKTETRQKGRSLGIEPMPGRKVLINLNRAYDPFC